MIYVVERYLPGLDRSGLLKGLRRLQQSVRQPTDQTTAVRYLGTTIVRSSSPMPTTAPGSSSVQTANDPWPSPMPTMAPAPPCAPERRLTKSVIGT